MSRGFKPQKRRQHAADGGLIRGPGTTTSDDIKTHMRPGSYILPADTTEKVSANNLTRDGRLAPVAVSDGEFQLTPEQVQAVGEQVLDAVRNVTHEPVIGEGLGFGPRQHLADGGVVDEEALRRRRFYVDANGQVRPVAPGQQTGMVPAGPRTTGGMPAPAPQFNATVTNPALATGTVTPQPAGFRPLPGSVGGDYAARANAMHNRMRDTANYNASRAAQDAKFAQAGPAPAVSPVPAANGPGFGTRARQILTGPAASKIARSTGPISGAVTALPEVADTAMVAQDDQSTGLDTATQASEGVARVAGTGAGAALGAKVGGFLGAFGGPLAWATVPAGAIAGGAVGGYIGNRATDAAIREGRELVGTDPSSPADRVRARQPQAPLPLSYDDSYVPEPESDGSEANNITRVGNSFSGTNIGPGFTVNGRPSSEADPLMYHADNPAEAAASNWRAKLNLFERTPGWAGGNTGVPAAGNAGNAPMPFGFRPGANTGGGPRATLIRNSGTPSNAEILRERMRNQRNTTDAQTQRAADQTSLQRESLDIQRSSAEMQARTQQQQAQVAARAEQRMEALRQAYTQATTDEERAQIALAMRDLQGQARPQPQIARQDRLVNPDDPLSQKLTESFIVDPTGQVRPLSNTSSARVPPQNHIDALMKNPNLAAQFDEIYGPGAAARYGAR